MNKIISVCIFKADIPSNFMGNDRIVGGFDTKASLQYQIGVAWKDTKFNFCGGTLVTRRHVLSAAHCFEGKNMDDLILHAGTYDIHNMSQV
jgi:secreted trypsin-like serine protease